MQHTRVRLIALLLAGALLALGACGGDSGDADTTTTAPAGSSTTKDTKPPRPKPPRTTTTTIRVVSDPEAVAQADDFDRRINTVLPQYCPRSDFARNITYNPEMRLVAPQARAFCTVWSEQMEHYVFLDDAERDSFVSRRTEIICEGMDGLAGSNWVLERRAATLVPSSDAAVTLAALLDGEYHLQPCREGVRVEAFPTAANEAKAAATILGDAGVDCGGFAVDISSPIYRKDLELTAEAAVAAQLATTTTVTLPSGDPAPQRVPNRRVVSVYGTCTEEPTVRIVGISPEHAGKDTSPQAALLRHLCRAEPDLQAVVAPSVVVLTPDAATASKASEALADPDPLPVTPVCDAEAA